MRGASRTPEDPSGAALPAPIRPRRRRGEESQGWPEDISSATVLRRREAFVCAEKDRNIQKRAISCPFPNHPLAFPHQIPQQASEPETPKGHRPRASGRRVLPETDGPPAFGKGAPGSILPRRFRRSRARRRVRSLSPFTGTKRLRRSEGGVSWGRRRALVVCGGPRRSGDQWNPTGGKTR